MSERIRELQLWLRTEARGSEYDAQAVADLIDEWIGEHDHAWVDVTEMQDRDRHERCVTCGADRWIPQ